MGRRARTRHPLRSMYMPYSLSVYNGEWKTNQSPEIKYCEGHKWSTSRHPIMLEFSSLLLLRSKFLPHPIRNGLLIPDEVDALMRGGGFGPALESWSLLLQQRWQLGTKQTVLRLTEAENAEHK